MTVFKGFLTIAKRNLGMMFLYILIFLTISLFIQNALSDSTTSGFQAESLPIAVLDLDGGELAEGMKDYLASIHHVKELPNDQRNDSSIGIFITSLQFLRTSNNFACPAMGSLL